MLPFARDGRLRTRRPVLHEGLEAGDIDRDGAARSGTVGEYHAIRTARYLYVEWINGARELYDRARDPRRDATRATATAATGASAARCTASSCACGPASATSAASRSGRSAGSAATRARHICWRLRRCRDSFFGPSSRRCSPLTAVPAAACRARTSRCPGRSAPTPRRAPSPPARGTQISLRGAPASRLGRIRVTGAKSGRHSGRLRAHSDGQGASFVLARKLRQGERVTVRTDLPIRGTSNGDFTFRTARMPKRVTIQNLHPREHPGQEDAQVPLAPRPRAAVRHRRHVAARPGARPPVPEPEVQARREAGRPADRRQQRPADLVPAAARDRRRHRLPHPDLPGQAGAHLLARAPRARASAPARW